MVICGGGLAGLTLALQLRKELPELSVAVVEKSARPLPESAHKVGESSVELGCQYFHRVGLQNYMKERHFFKFGLRFFPGGGELPLEQRAEYGPSQEPVVPSYQIDRGRFEEDVMGFVEAAGATLFEGCTVRDLVLGEGGAAHTLVAERGEHRQRLESTWLVDASGRTALIRKRLKLKRGTAHTAHAGWFRVKGKIDIDDLVPPEAKEWHDHPWAKERWRSTNHLMGTGYWLWLIPLSCGNTSVGVVVHGETHSFDRVRTLERLLEFIDESRLLQQA